MITIHCDDVITLSHMYTHTHTPTHTQGDPGINGDDGTPGNPGRMGPPGKTVSGTLLAICLSFTAQTLYSFLYEHFCYTYTAYFFALTLTPQ